MRRRLPLALLASLLVAGSLHGGDVTLGSGQYRLIGASFDVTPVEQTVPVGVAAAVRTVFGGSAQTLAATGARVAAELSGPGVPSPVTISAAPGEDLVVPPLSVKGEYRLDNIRLADGAGTSIPAAHPSARIVVSDILVTRVTSHALTSAELASRGIVVNDSNFKAYSFALGLAIQGRTITIEIPTVIRTSTGYQPVGPPVVGIENRDERFVPPTVIAVPLSVEGMPDTTAPDPEVIEEGEVTPTPVFGVLVFPGNIRFLNQFFSVVLMVQNGAASGSALSIRDVKATISLPAASLRLAQTTPAVPDGEPLPVREPGPDNVLGTADDVSVIVAQATGQAELVTEGLRVGTHEVTCDLEATLDGLANQPPRKLTGRARGSVLVRDPSFGLTFNHPDVVRSGEDYELRVTVANTSTVLAQEVSISIDAASITGATPVGVPQGVDPVAALGSIPPGESRLAKFSFHATRTGRVVASSFTSDGPVVGSLRLRMGVTNDGIPLSPDTFIFPGVISALPPEVVDPATALIGIAHGLATMDPTAPGAGCAGLGVSCSARFGDGVVSDRVADLVTAARRTGLGEPVASAVADLTFAWLGEAAPSPGFDRVRRSNDHGRELEAGIAAVLGDHLAAAGPEAFRQTLLDAAFAALPPFDPALPLTGPVWAILDEGEASDPTARLYLGDQATGALTGLAPGEPGFVRDTPFSALFPLAGTGGGELGIVGIPGAAGVTLGISGRKTGTVGLTVFFPDGAGGFRQARFDGLVTVPGSVTNVLVTPGAAELLAISATDVLRTASAAAASPTPFAPYGAYQDLDASPVGTAVSLVFNRPLDRVGAADVRGYRLPAPRADGGSFERRVTGAFPGETDPRHVVLVSGTVISPFRPGDVVGTNVPGRDGALWNGTLPIVTRLSLPGGTVSGRVIGPDGTPLANAPVRLSEAATDDLSGEVFQATTSVTTTDAAGGFFFDYVRKQDGKPFRIDSFDAITGSKGYAVGSIRTQGQTVQVDVVLQGRGTVQGTVVDGGGSLLPGMIVRCSSGTDGGFRTAQLSDANGAFSFASVPVGNVQLQAEDPLTNRTAFATAVLGAPGAVATKELVLAQLPRTSLRGTVLHGSDGSPYPNVYVAGYGQLGEYFGVRLTGADGTFAFASAPAGNARLELFDPASSTGSLLVQAVTLVADLPAEVTLTVTETTPRYGSIAGVVRRTVAGVPVPAPGLVVFERSSGLRTTSSSDGSYRLDGAPVGNDTVVALDPSTGRSVSAQVGVQENLTSTADLLFADASLGSIAGVVVDQQGMPKSGVAVAIYDEGPPIVLVAHSVTAADGSFTLLDLPPGPHRVQATFAEQRGAISLRNAGASTVIVPGPGTTVSTTIQLRGWLTVTGRVIARVRDRDGVLHDNPVFAPVELQTSRFTDGQHNPDPEVGPLYVDGPSAYTTQSTDPESGTFRFDDVRGGPVRLVVRNPFYGDRELDLGFVQGDSSRGPLDVVFEGNIGVVDGYLFDADGTPVVGGSVTLSGAPGFTDFEARTRPAGPSNDAGYFVFPLVPFTPVATVRFTGTVNGVERFAEAHVSVSAQAPTARATLRALGVGTVGVRVVQPTGNDLVPVPGAQVRVEELGGLRRSFTQTTDAAGRASFPNVTEGHLTVLGRLGLFAGRASVFASGEGFQVDGVVTLTGTARVYGTVRSPVDGSAVPNANVVLSSLGGGGLSIGPLAAGTSAADGSYDLSDVPAVDGATYRVEAEDSGTLRHGRSTPFVLAAGDDREIDVIFRPRGSVAGRLTSFDGVTPFAGVPVDVRWEASAAGERWITVTTDGDGLYRADGVPAGSVSVSAYDALTGLSARGSGTLSSEGEVVTIDLRATPTGRVQGIVRAADGSPLGAAAAVPTVSLSASRTWTVTAKTYDFAGVPAAGDGFVLYASEPVSPFHAALSSGTVGAGQTATVDLRYGPFGTVNVHVRKPDPATPGAFLPAPGLVTIYQGGPYASRFPSWSSFRTDSQGDLTIIDVGGGFGLRVTAIEDGSGAAGSVEVPDFTSDGQTAETTVVVEPRGIVRGRILLPGGVDPAPQTAVGLYLKGYGVSPVSLPGATSTAVTGADGRFEMRDIPLRELFVVAGTASPVSSAYGDGELTPAAPILDMGDLVLDDVRPTVVSREPADGSTGVGLTPTIRFTFSEPIWPYGGSVGAFVRLSTAAGELGSYVPASLDATGTVLSITPNDPLPGNTLCEVRLLGGIRDRSLLEMGADVVLRFTTADLTNPVLVRSQPVSGQVQVSVLQNPTVVLSKPLDPASVAGGAHLERLDTPAGSIDLAPALQADGRTIVLNPSTPLVAEAEYQVVLDALRDVAGNPLLSTVRIPFFTRDDQAPSLTLDTPDTATPVEGTTHTYTVRYDDDDVKTVTLYLLAPTGEIRNAVQPDVSPPRTDRSVSYTVTLPRISAAGGTAIRVRTYATDFGGNGSQPVDLPLTLQVDAPPAISSAVPSASAVKVGGTFSVTVSATDDRSLNRIDATLAAGLEAVSTEVLASSATGRTELRTYRVRLDAAPGPASVSFVAQDGVGQLSPATPVSVTVVPDDPPSVAIVAPAANSTFLSGSSFPVTFSSSDDLGVASVTISLGGSQVTVPSPAGTATASLTAPMVASAQAASITAVATDSTGHTSSASVAVTVLPDAPPTVTVASPATGTHVQAGATLLLTGSLEDDNRRATLTATLGSVTRTASTVGPFTLAFAAPVVTVPTPVTLAVRARDNTGHEAAPVDVPLVVDPDTVAPTIAIGSPSAGATVIGGVGFSLVATASDDVAVTAFRYRIDGGAFIAVNGAVLSTQVPTSAVGAPTPLTIDLEAEDPSGHLAGASRQVTVVPNLPPTLAVTQPASGARITAGTAFSVAGSASDDSGVPTVTVTFDGVPRNAVGQEFSIGLTAPAVSTVTDFVLTVSARDPQGNASAPVAVPVTVVPDVGGTPTVALTAPAPAVLCADETSSVSLTFADNVGLFSGTAEVTGAFVSGPRSYALSGTSAVRDVPVTQAVTPFGETARITARNVDLGGRTALLDLTLPVAYHRLETPLPPGPYAEGGTLTGTFRISASGRARAAALRFEIGTLSGQSFTVVTCVQKLAPLGALETLSVPIPVGRNGLYARSVLVETTGARAVGATADRLSLLVEPIATTGDGASPTVSISIPAPGTPVVSGDPLAVSVTASDDTRIERVDVAFAGITKSCSSAPCAVTFFAPVVSASTAQTITATARDGAGKSASASVSVTVVPRTGGGSQVVASGPVRGDGVAPTLRFLTPYVSPAPVAPGALFRPAVEATDADGIEKVELSLGPSGEPCLTLRPPTPARGGCLVPDAPAGTRLTLRAVAFDRSGDRSERETELVVVPGPRLGEPGVLRASPDLVDRTVFVEADVRLEGALSVGSLVVRDGGSLSATPGQAVAVKARSDVFLDTGSVVTATGMGPAPSSDVPELATPAGEGGAHGGDAGSRLGFDSFVTPRLPGASGGDSPDGAFRGSRGGGVVTIEAHRIVLAGTVEAGGGPQLPGRGAGIGAGGSVRLEAVSEIRATSGALPDGPYALVSAVGGAVTFEVPPAALGAGGRVALAAPLVEAVDVDVSGSDGGDHVGAAGTAYVRDEGHPNGVLLIRGQLAPDPEGDPPAVPIASSHIPALGCGRLEPRGEDGVAQPGRRLPLGLSGVWLELTGPSPRRFRILEGTPDGFRLELPAGEPRLSSLAGRSYCGLVVLDGLLVRRGARAVFSDRLEVPPHRIVLDPNSSLEKP